MYCIQYQISCNTGDRYKHQNTHPDISPVQQKLLQRALIFGYIENTDNLYSGNWVDNVMGTRISGNLLQDNPTARGIYNQIRANMKSYSTIPSFTASSAKDYEMKYDMKSTNFKKKQPFEHGKQPFRHELYQFIIVCSNICFINMIAILNIIKILNRSKNLFSITIFCIVDIISKKQQKCAFIGFSK